MAEESLSLAILPASCMARHFAGNCLQYLSAEARLRFVEPVSLSFDSFPTMPVMRLSR